MVPLERLISVIQSDGTLLKISVTRLGVGPLDTDLGAFNLYEFDVADNWGQYVALVKSPVDSSFMPIFPPAKQIPLRIDSGCCTGQIFHDRTCECQEQLRFADDDDG